MGAEPTGCGRVAARLHRQVERALAPLKLSPGQYRLMASLSDGPSEAHELAERLIVSRPSVTALADALVERGLVSREHSPDDRRRVIHVLTARGSKKLATADRALDARIVELTSELGDADRHRAFGGLHALRKALDLARARALGEKVKA